MEESKILIVDDEENVRASIQGVLQDEGYQVDSVASGEECVKYLEKKQCELVLLDIWLPGKDGIETLKELKGLRPSLYVIMISGHGTIETAVQATKLGAFDFIEKPISLEKMVLVVQHALKQQRLEEENRNLKDFLRQETIMIGRSVPMQALRQQIEYAAPTEGRVLIYGENGTGKELVARNLHLLSHRRDRNFVEINCAAIPEDLIESELFGSIKGAYTGAGQSRKGKFELAHRGTLFLDEVGDMSLKTQAKVLRVLEKQRFYPVGGNQPVEVDVRVIAATNKNLDEEIDRGTFREDLFFRLNVIPFEVPPLRERAEDIPELLEFFLERFCRAYGRPTKKIPPAVMKQLQAYHWPGNVRELRNTAERLAIMVPGGEIGALDLPLSILRCDPNGSRKGPRKGWQKAREEFEREFILRSLIENEGNISRTAAMIGVDRTQLHRKIRAYKIRLK